MATHPRLSSLLATCLFAIGQLVAQTPIQYSPVVTGVIDCSLTNSYTLTGNAGDRVVAHVTEVVDYGGCNCGRCTCDFDQCIEIRSDQNEILGTACSPLDFNACGNATRTQLGPITLPRDGKYTVSVRDANSYGRGLYALSIQKSVNPVRAEAISSEVDRIVPIQTAGEISVFTFNVAQDTDLNISLLRETGNVVPRIVLYGTGGEPVALPESGTATYRVRQTGQHALFIFSAGPQIGTLRLRLTNRAAITSGQILSQIADGNGWQTSMLLVNHGSDPAPYSFRTYADSGAPWMLSWDGRSEGTLPVGGSLTIRTANRDATTRQGWGQLIASQPVGVLGVFRSSNGQEAAVSGTAPVTRFLLPFDNTQGMVTSMAIVNSNDVRNAVIRVAFRDEAGVQLGTQTITLSPLAHDAFALPERFPIVKGRRGVAEFVADTPDITGLGLRFAAGGAFTSFPVQSLAP